MTFVLNLEIINNCRRLRLLASSGVPTLTLVETTETGLVAIAIRPKIKKVTIALNLKLDLRRGRGVAKLVTNSLLPIMRC